MPKLTRTFDWPNGEGYTECSEEYFLTQEAAEALKPPGTNMDDLAPADYQTWNTLDNRLQQMQAEGGHLKPHRY